MKPIIKIISTALLLFYFNPTFACICFPPTFEKAIDGAREIFLGKVVHIESVQLSEERFVAKYRFEVIKKWKGNTAKYVNIYATGSNCDLWFKVGETPVLVYAWSNTYPPFESNQDSIISNDKLATNQCSRTVISNNRREDKRQQFENDTILLRQVFPNLILVEEKITLNPLSKIPFLVIGGIVILIFLLVIWLIKKSKIT